MEEVGVDYYKLLDMVFDGVVVNISPELVSKPRYHYLKDGSLALLGIFGPSFMKGENKEKATKIGVGLASAALLSIINRALGDEKLVNQTYTIKPINSCISTTNYYKPAEPVKYNRTGKLKVAKLVEEQDYNI